MVFTWGLAPLTTGASTVEVVLTPDGEETLVTLTHRDLPEPLQAPHGAGWKHFLARLAIVAGGGDDGPDLGVGGMVARSISSWVSAD